MSLACASGVWFVGDDLVQGALATGAAAAAVTGSVLLRAWDRTAGKSVAELKTARVRDEWKTDERIAELETDLEESREIRGRLDTKLRAKRAELARLRSEHAELLRRYATAETERASALEGRRLLAIEAGTPAGELTAGEGPDCVPGTLTAVMYHRAAEALRHLSRNAARQAEHGPAGRVPARDGEDGQGNPVAATEPSAEQGRPRTAADPQPTGSEPDGSEQTGTEQAGTESDGSRPGDVVAAAGEDSNAVSGSDAPAGDRSPAGADARDAGRQAGRQTARPAPNLRPVPAAAAVVPPVKVPRLPASRVQGGFDFFGTATGTGAVRNGTAPTGPGTGVPSAVPRRAKPARQLEEDLADVVGDEAVAEQSARGRARTTDEVRSGSGRKSENGPESAAGSKPGEAGDEAAEAAETEAAAVADAAEASDGGTTEGAAEEASESEGSGKGDGEIIDLTAHDETEQIDLVELRSAVSS
ncbi:hypothetical protein ADK76_20160 [Streptomyces griseoflavus]|uniref:hypothetical protein n=1 Tax=Streptomyces rimosus TaxID=1927 RepID=UPI00069D6BFD|nr:hypothetical protein [Streptomyces rimosus]KOG56175.1 hypothetical protein ADK76_20160 [Streptomyces griseoflavus]